MFGYEGVTGIMVDISDLGGGSGKRRAFPPFEKSAVERLAEATKSPFDLDFGMKTMREGLGAADRLGMPSLHTSAAERSIREALGGSLGDYYKSRDHMRDVFSSKSLADEVDKLTKGPSAGTEVDRYMAELD